MKLFQVIEMRWSWKVRIQRTSHGCGRGVVWWCSEWTSPGHVSGYLKLCGFYFGLLLPFMVQPGLSVLSHLSLPGIHLYPEDSLSESLTPQFLLPIVVQGDSIYNSEPEF
jgi:hypothetical protein